MIGQLKPSVQPCSTVSSDSSHKIHKVLYGSPRDLRLLCLVDPAAASDASRAADGPTWRAKARASLLSLDLHDFKSFKRRQFQLEGRSLSCVVGCNSSGKSAVLDALRFALGRQCDRNLRDYIRRGKPMTSNARVTLQFRYEQEAEEGSLQGTRRLKTLQCSLVELYFDICCNSWLTMRLS